MHATDTLRAYQAYLFPFAEPDPLAPEARPPSVPFRPGYWGKGLAWAEVVDGLPVKCLYNGDEDGGTFCPLRFAFSAELVGGRTLRWDYPVTAQMMDNPHVLSTARRCLDSEAGAAWLARVDAALRKLPLLAKAHKLDAAGVSELAASLGLRPKGTKKKQVAALTLVARVVNCEPDRMPSYYEVRDAMRRAGIRLAYNAGPEKTAAALRALRAVADVKPWAG